MSSEKTEGIILQAADLKERDLLLTVFTIDRGVMKLIYNQGRASYKRRNASLAPLTRAELIYRDQGKDFMKCQELSTLDPYTPLRIRYDTLETAGSLLQAILKTQLPGNPAPLLYALLERYLEQLKSTPRPWNFKYSFLLKLLRHEGLLSELHCCSLCQAPLAFCHMYRGECICPLHPQEKGVPLDQEDLELVRVFAHSRSLSQIEAITLLDRHPQMLETITNEPFLR